MIEGDIAKMAVNDYENSQNQIRYLCAENEQLKRQNHKLLEEMDKLKKDMQQGNQAYIKALAELKKEREMSQTLKRKMFGVKRAKEEIGQMQSHETIVLMKQMENIIKELDQYKVQNICLKDKIKCLREGKDMKKSRKAKP